MTELHIYIERDPVQYYKLTGKRVSEYHKKALENAKDLYLEFYDTVYRGLMTKDFNPLWMRDGISDNDVDFKDDFGEVSYFLFNVCLLRLLKKEYRIKVVDQTRFKFRNQEDLYSFLKQEGIELEKIHKPDRLIDKNAIKKFVLQSLRELPENICSIPKNFSERFLLKRQEIREAEKNKKTLYLYVEPVGKRGEGGKMEFIKWRYANLLDQNRQSDCNIVFISTIDFLNSDQKDIPFLNVNRLVSKSDLLRVFLKSLYLRVKISNFIISRRLDSRISAEFKFFLKNAPRNMFYPLREHLGFKKLFDKVGPGLLVIKGPIVNKGSAIQIYNAKQNGVRVLVISGRILTPTRLSNQFVKSHSYDLFPNVLPHSMVVDDKMSFETIRKQSDDIELYPLEKKYDYSEKYPANPFRVTLVLQKKKEIEQMVEEVIQAIEGLDGIVLNLKMHPLFPIHRHLLKRYNQFSFVNVLPLHTQMNVVIENSDLCITAYSTAALEFAMKGSPVVWLKNVTFNRLFFADLQEEFGIVTENSDELRSIIIKMKDDKELYKKEVRLQQTQLNKIIYTPDERTYSLKEILNSELAKA